MVLETMSVTHVDRSVLALTAKSLLPHPFKMTVLSSFDYRGTIKFHSKTYSIFPSIGNITSILIEDDFILFSCNCQ